MNVSGFDPFHASHGFRVASSPLDRPVSRPGESETAPDPAIKADADAAALARDLSAYVFALRVNERAGSVLHPFE